MDIFKEIIAFALCLGVFVLFHILIAFVFVATNTENPWKLK